MALFKNKTNTLISETARATAKAVREEFGIPIDGGNFYTQQQQLEATDNLIKSYSQSSFNLNSVFENNKTKNYNLWFLLQQQADYWSRVVNFSCDDIKLVKNIYIALRVAVIYGRCLIEFKDKHLMAYYIHTSKLDEYDIVKECNVTKASTVLMNQSIDFEPKLTFKKPITDNCYILDFSSLGVGGLVLWLPFLKQLENILVMLGNDVWSYFKKYEWLAGSSASSDMADLKSFVNPNYPFYIRTMAQDDPRELGLKIVGKELKNEVKIKEYLDDFLDVYYSLFGRRFNNVKKNERNIKSEADAGVSGFDVLQSEWSNYIKLFLEWVQKISGTKIEVVDVKKDEKEKEKVADDVSRMSECKPSNIQ